MVDIAQCVAECLEEEAGLPQDCGFCVGLATECIVVECFTDCIDPESPACDDCVLAAGPECNEVFATCAGFPPP